MRHTPVMPSSNPSLLSQFKAMWRLYRNVSRDPRTPSIAKVLPWLSLIYILMPFDVIPDIFPLVGWVDDLGMIPLLIWIALQFVPPHIKADAQRGKVIDVEKK